MYLQKIGKYMYIQKLEDKKNKTKTYIFEIIEITVKHMSFFVPH